MAVSRRQFMERSVGGLAVAGMGAPALLAQDWARQAVDKSPRKHEWVSVKQGTRSVESFLAHPQGSGKMPGIVVIHEIFGLSDWVEDVTDEFAAAGYVAIAPDLLSGLGPNGGRTKDFPAAAGGGMGGPVGQAIQKLPPEQVIADLNAVMDYLKKQPACNGKVAVVGFSWGGGKCFEFAAARKDLSAAYVFYGTPPPAAAMANIACPVYGFFGGNDQRVDATIPTATEQMKAAGKVFEPVVYEGAAHGFMRSGDQPDGPAADKKARDASWARINSITPKLK
jgi:carboxymethylenebutenolidase